MTRYRVFEGAVETSLTLRELGAYIASMLRPGSRIAVVAPGGAVWPEQLHAAIACLADWGWKPVLAPHLYQRHRFLAGTRSERAADLTWALTSTEIDAVWLARGGYGTAQLLASLPWERIAPRPVIGYSDGTGLLWALSRRGLSSVHGPALTTLIQGLAAVDDESRAAVRRLLALGETTPLPGQLLCGPDAPVRGRLVGGNLTVLASLAGTREELKAAGSVLFLEDVGEKPYRLERSLCQLIDSGALDGVHGVALGEFVDCEPQNSSYPLRDIWLEHLSPLRVPVIEGLPVGHGKRNIAMHYGVDVELHSAGLLWP